MGSAQSRVSSVVWGHMASGEGEGSILSWVGSGSGGGGRALLPAAESMAREESGSASS